MRIPVRVCGILLASVALIGCQRSSPKQTHASSHGGSKEPPLEITTRFPKGTLTFNKDIAPILFAHCAACHRPGESAPFSVLDYREVRSRADDIATATKDRVMPPWLPEPGYGEFLNERRLKDDQIAMIQQWAEEGAVEGDAAARPSLPTWPEGWQLGQPDLILKMPQPYVLPAAGKDVFRYFVIPLATSSTRYVRALEFRPGNPRVLHHASVGVDRMRLSRKIDARDPEPGFAAMPDDQVQNVYGWTPGKAPFLEPAERAWPLERGSDLVVQLHMLPSGKSETIQPTLGLFFSSAPPSRVPLAVKLESKAIDIPAGKADYTIEDHYVLPADIDVLSVYPHAHYLAKDMKGFARLPDGSVKWLIWIKAWDFHWQDQYRYDSPLFLPKGTTLTMRFTYDNSGTNMHNPHQPPRRVKWGPQSSDEMSALWLEVLPRRPEDVGILMSDYAQRSLRADIAGAEMQVQTSPGDALAHNFLATKYLQAGRLLEAIAELEEALRLKPDDAEARSNLGSALQLQGRLAEALQHLRQAARLSPDDDRVHFNLGNAMNASGRPDEAIREFSRAVEINPENADAHFNLAIALGSQNRLDEAVAHLRRTIDINPQNADAHRNLGMALGLQGRLDAGIVELREALRIRPEFPEAQRNLASLVKAKGK